jgi:triosephosphate isomerase
MYKTIPEATEFIKKLAELLHNGQVRSDQEPVYIAVPFTAISAAVEAAQGSPIVVGAQNMNDATEGAFTGEIAARMVKDAGARFVILGHSERRRLFGEDNAFVNRKILKALAEGLQSIVCLGETLDQREAGETEEVLEEQLLETLEGVSQEALSHLILAYEPIWAIGTGVAATPEVVQKTHAMLRQMVAKQWGEEAAQRLLIQYGGSVKSENSELLLAQSDIDGFLVGGASLSPQTFYEIVCAAHVKMRSE